jgi:hypothetical protein
LELANSVTSQENRPARGEIYRADLSHENFFRQSFGSRQRGCKRVARLYFAFNPFCHCFIPPGRQFAFGKSLAIEFSTEVFQSILVIWLLAQTGIGSFAGRVGFVLIAGILAAITTNVSYWN